jgi:hypothetical protein
MVLDPSQVLALLPGVVFLAIGLKRLITKFFSWIKYLVFDDDTALNGGSRRYFLHLATGFTLTVFGASWLLVLTYFGMFPGV